LGQKQNLQVQLHLASRASVDVAVGRKKNLKRVVGQALQDIEVEQQASSRKPSSIESPEQAKAWSHRNKMVKLLGRVRLSRSRFGFDWINHLAKYSGNPPEIDGFHLHNDEGHLSVTEFSAQLRKIQRRLRKTGFSPQIINLGGGLSNYTSAEVRKLFKQARNIFRNTPHIFFEPGRLFHNNSGYACGKILSSKPGTRPILTTNLSKECHLKWSNQNLLFLEFSHSASSVLTTFDVVGPTCYEKDIIGTFRTRIPAPDKKAAYGRIIFSGINGYSVAWNTSFNGIPKALVRFLD
jgi:diaminopimelate decarboxylase